MRDRTKRIVELLKKNDWENSKVYLFWKEFIDEFANEESYRRSVRKACAKYNPDYVNKDNTEIDSKVEELTSKIRFLKKQNEDLKKARNKQLDNKHLAKYISDNIKDLFDDCRDEYFFNIDKPNGNKTMIMNVSDIHYGENVNFKAVYGVNEYDTTVAQERIIELFTRALETSIKEKCSDLELIFMGDIFSGDIHDELREDSDLSTIEYILPLAKFFRGILHGYSEKFKHINVTCVVGNHGRTTKKTRFKSGSKLNYEYLFYIFLSELLSEYDNIEFDIPDSLGKVVNINNFNVFVHHGNCFRGGNGISGFPFVTMSRDTIKKQFSMTDKFEYAMFGHFHKFANFVAIDGTKIFANGSVIGGNEFSVEAVSSSYPPSQNIYVANNDKIEYVREIHL